ncbi:MAG: Xaa-Pro peptidase family protein [Acidimicrobiia bacterium]|nr:Xaa-Pro peptidase family protein [Acidimicrobiia bacterium]
MELDWHAAAPDPEVFAGPSGQRLTLWHRRPPEETGGLGVRLERATDDVDLAAVRRYRLERVRAEMRRRDIAACLLFDPVNIRYATGARNMQVFTSRNPARYLVVTADGPVVLHEFTGAEHLGEGLETIDEVRAAVTASFVAAGPGIVERERGWAATTAATLRELVGAGVTVGVERINAGAAMALAEHGFRLVDAQEPVEMARCIKSDEELACIRASLRATEAGVAELRAALRPGITENELWAVLHHAVIARDADYVETRLLTSGPRTNPWFQESSPRVIQPNELVALDTDVVGCHGYYADFSRTFHAGPAAPTPLQREVYRAAWEQVHHNIGILRPGMTFREYAEEAWEIPQRFFEHRYYLSAHGVGMTGEYPYLYHRADFPDAGYDGVIEPGMTLCVESFIGEQGGAEGVKLEEQVLITETGVELLSDFPFEDALLA